MAGDGGIARLARQDRLRVVARALRRRSVVGDALDHVHVDADLRDHQMGDGPARRRGGIGGGRTPPAVPAARLSRCGCRPAAAAATAALKPRFRAAWLCASAMPVPHSW